MWAASDTLCMNPSKGMVFFACFMGNALVTSPYVYWYVVSFTKVLCRYVAVMALG